MNLMTRRSKVSAPALLATLLISFTPLMSQARPQLVTQEKVDGDTTIRLTLEEQFILDDQNTPCKVEVIITGADKPMVAGDSVTVRAVAESEDVQWSTPGWPQEETLVRDRTQGWVLSTLSITADPNDAQDTALTPPAEEEVSGCGGRAVWVWWGLLGIGLQMRRRGSIQQS